MRQCGFPNPELGESNGIRIRNIARATAYLTIRVERQQMPPALIRGMAMPAIPRNLRCANRPVLRVKPGSKPLQAAEEMLMLARTILDSGKTARYAHLGRRQHYQPAMRSFVIWHKHHDETSFAEPVPRLYACLIAALEDLQEARRTLGYSDLCPKAKLNPPESYARHTELFPGTVQASLRVSKVQIDAHNQSNGSGSNPPQKAEEEKI
jgi:hypothetical protein